MYGEQEKVAYEKEVFLRFLSLIDSHVDKDTIRAGDPRKNEPDILCEFLHGGDAGFELGRLTNQTLKMVQKSRTPERYPYVWCGEDSLRQARKKIRKRYSVNVPVKLLLYTEYPTSSPESYIREVVKPLARSLNHQYAEIWFMGKDTATVIYERPLISLPN